MASPAVYVKQKREELRMAAYSINPCDRGSIMNNSTITQRPEWHFTLVAWEKKTMPLLVLHCSVEIRAAR